MSEPSAYRIEQAMSVALALRDRLLADDPDLAADERVLRDTLDGETEIYDVMRRLARFALESQAQCDVAMKRVDNLTERADRFKRRADRARAALFAIMDALGERKLIDAEFTVSVRPGTPSVQITDETLIPDAFMITTRKPNKAAIAAALKADQPVAGAELSNAASYLAIKST
ncbi:MAG TPA: siphovirus Gp157 family protein [Acidocella sp.]|nr:siphovirus Gp157 family protein [Acidocella sp.]